jgi:hypothetical protein
VAIGLGRHSADSRVRVGKKLIPLIFRYQIFNSADAESDSLRLKMFKTKLIKMNPLSLETKCHAVLNLKMIYITPKTTLKKRWWGNRHLSVEYGQQRFLFFSCIFKETKILLIKHQSDDGINKSVTR